MTIAEDALIELLAAWRATRSSKLADAIDRVSLDVTRSTEPIVAKTVAARTSAWVAIAAKCDPIDVGRLLAVPLPRQIKTLSTAIDTLLTFDDDPRIAVALARFLEEGILTTFAGRRLEVRALSRIGTMRDVRVVGRLRAVAGGYRRNEYPIEEVIAQLEQAEREAVLDEHALALVERYGGGEADADTARLLDAVYADPGDRAALEVLGDRLSEVGDPRGELISLQLAAPSEANDRRIRELVEQHGRTWTGDLDRYFAEDHRVFERGFFAGGLLLATSDAIDDIVKDPAWALVRTLHVAPPSELLGTELLERPELRSLRAFGIASPGVSSSTLRELHVRSDVALQLSFGDALPALRVLGMWTGYDELAAWCARAPLVERLEKFVLVVGGERGPLDALARRSGSLREIELLTSTEQFHATWVVRLSRTAAPGPFTHLAIEYRPSDDVPFAELGQKLAEIPSEWPHDVTVETHGRMLAAADARTIEAHLARFTSVATTTLPWQRAQGGQTVSITLGGTGDRTPDVLAALWEPLAAFGQRYDAFSVNQRDTLRPLGKKPLERVLSWLAKRSTYWVTLQRTGNTERIRTMSAIEIDVALGERSYADFVEWFPAIVGASRCDRATVHATALRGSWNFENFGSFPNAGWIMLFGPIASAYLDIAGVRALSAHPLLPELFADTIEDHLVVGLARTPEDVRPEMWTPLRDGMMAILYRNFAARAGYDFDALAIAAFGPIAARHGLELQSRSLLYVEYLRQGTVNEPRASISARLDTGQVPPHLRISLHAWPTPERGTHAPVERVPIESRADLEAQIAIAVQTFTELEPWLTAHLTKTSSTG